MRRSLLRPLVVAMIAIVSAMAVSVSGVLAHNRSNHGPPPPPPAGSFVVTGNVQQKLRLSVADLAAMPNQKTVDVEHRAGSGTEHRVFTGPLLLDVLAKAGPRFDPAIKNDKLRHYVSVTASDAYQALVAYGELDPGFENKQILLAVTQDGASLAEPGAAARRAGRHGGRALRDRSREGEDRQAAPLSRPGGRAGCGRLRPHGPMNA